MPIAIFLCPMVEEPFRGGTRRRPSVMCIPSRPGHGYLTIAEDLDDMALVAIDAPDDELARFAEFAQVKQVTDMQRDISIQSEFKTIAAEFATKVSAQFESIATTATVK